MTGPWQREIGNVCLTVKLETDEYPDLSWLGEYSQYREPTPMIAWTVIRSVTDLASSNGLFWMGTKVLLPTRFLGVISMPCLTLSILYQSLLPKSETPT